MGSDFQDGKFQGDKNLSRSTNQYLNPLANLTGIDELNTSGEFLNIARTSAKYATGARTIIRINNKIVAFANQVSWNIETINTELRTIDNFLPQELVPNMIRVSGSISGFKIPGVSLTGQYLQANPNSFIHHKYISIEVRDSVTDALLFKANKAAIARRTENYEAGNISRLAIDFIAIGWQEEGMPTTLPVDYDKKSPPSQT